jgi:hypothetical protein
MAIFIARSHQGWRVSGIGCEGCGRGFVGFMAFGLWIEFDFLHGKDHGGD